MRNFVQIHNLRKALPIVAERQMLLKLSNKDYGKRLIAMDIGTSKTGISTTDKAKTIAMPWGLIRHDWDGHMEDDQFKRFTTLLLQTSAIVAGGIPIGAGV